MGIRNLNKHIRTVAQKCIVETPMKNLVGSSVVVDANNYLHRFVAEDGIVVGLYQLLSQFMRHNIRVLFVFDGKPPAEKTRVIAARTRDREQARVELALRRDSGSRQLRRRCARVAQDDFADAFMLFDSMGVPYIRANGEAESLCAALVNGGHVDYCLSEDTDLFLYDCRAVLRYLSLVNDTVVYYPWHAIRDCLGLDQNSFVRCCVATGTDYNDACTKSDLPSILDTARTNTILLDAASEATVALFTPARMPTSLPDAAIPQLFPIQHGLAAFLLHHGIVLYQGGGENLLELTDSTLHAASSARSFSDIATSAL